MNTDRHELEKTDRRGKRPPRNKRSGFRQKAASLRFLGFSALCRDAATSQKEFFSGRGTNSALRWLPVLALAAFVGALLWAKSRDPFQRIEFSLAVPGDGTVKGMAVLPKPAGKRPTVVWLHGAGGSLSRDGMDLRQIAELGLAAVAMEYDQTNQARFDEQFIALHDYLGRQSWAQSNATAWVGFSLGAQRTLAFVLKHPEIQPQLYVRLSGGWVEGLGQKSDASSQDSEDGNRPSDLRASNLGVQLSTNLHVLLIHFEQDDTFPVADCRRLAGLLKTNGIPVRLRVFPGESHSFDQDRPQVMRGLAEYCAGFFGSLQPLRANTRPSRWYYWLPLGLLAVLLAITGYMRRRASVKSPANPCPKLSKGLWLVASLAGVAALGQTALHLGLPRLSASEAALNLARRWLVRPAMKSDFDWLAGKPIWQGQRINTLLEHLELASLQKKFFYTNLDEETYRNFVLSPAVGSDAAGELNWRRELWESFYPRIRRESDASSAAQIVVRFLRERVTIVPDRVEAQGIETMWKRGVADAAGFEAVYVTALRSVGIAARLNSAEQAEFWDGKDWRAAPRPLLTTWKDLVEQ